MSSAGIMFHFAFFILNLIFFIFPQPLKTSSKMNLTEAGMMTVSSFLFFLKAPSFVPHLSSIYHWEFLEKLNHYVVLYVTRNV